MKIKLTVPYNLCLIVDSEHFSALNNIIEKSEIREEKYQSSGYIYVVPDEAEKKGVELSFIQDWQLEKDSKTVVKLLEEASKKSSEVYQLQKQIKEQAASIAQMSVQLTALMPPAPYTEAVDIVFIEE